MENTHTDKGKFAPGNKLGRGNPLAGKAAKLRAAMFEAVSEGDIYAIITKLIELARDGDIQAAKELLDRTLGKAASNDTLNITADEENVNPFRDYLDRNPKLAREAAVLIRRMASDAGDDGALDNAGQMAVAGSPGTVVGEAPRSGDDAE